MESLIERIEKFNSNRLENLRAVKYRLMSINAFNFYRGTCHLFFEDYVKQPIQGDDTLTWICGDLHLDNFGTYKGDNRLVYFDLNDFDEAVLAPATYEISRTLVSILLAGDELNLKGQESEKLVLDFLTRYYECLAYGKEIDIEKETAKGILKNFIQKVGDRKQIEIIEKFTRERKEGWELRTINEKIIALDTKKKSAVLKAINSWLAKHPMKALSSSTAIDAAFRIAGIGSVGVDRYIVLTINKNNPGKSYLLGLKEAKPSSLAPYIKFPQPTWKSEAERVSTVQHRMQFVTPALFTPFEMDGKSFILKELQPMEDKMDFTMCNGKMKKITSILCTMAELTASAQLRSSGRQGSCIADVLIEFGKKESLKHELIRFSKEYYKVVKGYYKEFSTTYDRNKSTLVP